MNKLKSFDSSYFIGKSHFEEDGTQNYLVFQRLNKYFKVIASTNYISSWQSKELSDETIKPPSTSDNSLNPTVNYYGAKARLQFRGSYLKEDKSTINNGKIINIYIIYELDKTYVKTHPKLVNCFFGAVSIAKNADIDKKKYSGYGIEFDRTGVCLLSDGSFGRNVVIFEIDLSSSVHVDNKGKDIILGTGPMQGLGEHSLTAEQMYAINFTDHRKKCCLNLHCNIHRANSYLFVNGIKVFKFKANDSKIIPTPLCLGNISKDWSLDNMKDTGLNGYVYDLE